MTSMRYAMVDIDPVSVVLPDLGPLIEKSESTVKDMLHHSMGVSADAEVQIKWMVCSSLDEAWTRVDPYEVRPGTAWKMRCIGTVLT